MFQHGIEALGEESIVTKHWYSKILEKFKADLLKSEEQDLKVKTCPRLNILLFMCSVIRKLS